LKKVGRIRINGQATLDAKKDAQERSRNEEKQMDAMGDIGDFDDVGGGGEAPGVGR